MRRLAVLHFVAERKRSNSRGSLRTALGLSENTNSIFCDGSSESRPQMECLVLPSAGPMLRGILWNILGVLTCTLSRADPGHIENQIVRTSPGLICRKHKIVHIRAYRSVCNPASYVGLRH